MDKWHGYFYNFDVQSTSMKNQYATTFHIKFVDDNKLTEIKIGELEEFMKKYHRSSRPEIPITWNLKYNRDSSVKIQLKLHYLDIEWPNDKCTQEKIMMT